MPAGPGTKPRRGLQQTQRDQGRAVEILDVDVAEGAGALMQDLPVEIAANRSPLATAFSYLQTARSQFSKARTVARADAFGVPLKTA